MKTKISFFVVLFVVILFWQIDRAMRDLLNISEIDWTY